jgi:TPR repeat protein
MIYRRLAVFVVLALLVGCVASPMREAEYDLGVDAYRVKDYTAARQHWLKSVEEHETSALNNLGYLFYYGLGGEADQVRAVSLWMNAASMGHSEAQWHLGRAFEDGSGVTQSLVEAYAWYRCAAANSQGAPMDDDSEAQIFQDASKSLTQLLAKLPADQLEVSENLAKQYIAKYAPKP